MLWTQHDKPTHCKQDFGFLSIHVPSNNGFLSHWSNNLKELNSWIKTKVIELPHSNIGFWDMNPILPTKRGIKKMTK